MSGPRTRVRPLLALAASLLALASITASAQSAPSIATTSLPSATVGTAYSAPVTVNGGKKPLLWTILSGSLPSGLLLDPVTGTISGTPTAAGTSTFTVLVTDASFATDSQALTLTVNPSVSVTTTSLPAGIVGVPYSQGLAATGGSGGYSWSVTSGSLPSGLSLSSAGAISGVPTNAGGSTFTVQAKDSSGATGTKQLTVQIAFPSLSVTTSTLATAAQGSQYSAQLSAAGGSGGYAWSLTSGSLPSGLTLDASGVISGVPSSTGSSTFTVQVRDLTGATATRSLTLAVAAPALAITTSSLPGGTMGVSYSQTLSATGGSGPYTWSINSGALPPGLSLSSGGVISGAPTTAGNYTFTVGVKDSSGAASSQNLGLSVGSPSLTITTSSLAGAVVGGSYSQTLSASGGSGPYTWSLSSGSLPSGLTLSSGGVISGAPTTAGNYTFTVGVKDASGATTTAALTLTVGSGVTITTAPALPSGSAGVQYSQTLAATGGTTPYTWSITAGSLPAGLDFSGGGQISGTPTASGAFTFTARAADSGGLSGTKDFTLTIGQGLSFTTPAALPNGTTGSAYTFTLGATGGQSPYSWSVTQGPLPPGLSLNSATGAIGGTPSTQGTYNFTLRVSDAAGQAVTRVHSIVIGLPSSGPSVTIGGIPPHLAPVQQLPVSVSLSTGFPVTMTGQLSVSFAPGGPNPMDDPAVQFSTGGRTASFTIPANTTQAVFSGSSFGVQVGSVTGTLTFSVSSLNAGGTPYTPSGGTTLSAQIDPFPPSIRSVTVVRVANGFNLQVVGVSDTRDLSSVSVRLQSGGTNPQTGVVNVPLGNAANAWFQAPDSGAYGGQFTLKAPFTFSGADPQLTTIGVTLSNSVGSSQESSANY